MALAEIEIGQKPPILAYQEELLAEYLDKGSLLSAYMTEAPSHVRLTQEDEYNLGSRMCLGELARREIFEASKSCKANGSMVTEAVIDGFTAEEGIILANLPLVVYWAKKYQGESGVPLLTLIGGGNMGLLRAVKRFDHTRDNKFSGYATWFIKDALVDCLRELRFPVVVRKNFTVALGRAQLVVQQFYRENQRMPACEELAAELSIPPYKVRKMLEILNPPLYLDSQFLDGDDERGDFSVADPDLTPEEQVEKRELEWLVKMTLGLLSFRYRKVLELRMGFYDGTVFGCREIGRCLGVSKQRAEQLEKAALIKIKEGEEFAALKNSLREYVFLKGDKY